jgi:glyoxylase I family protein
MKAAVLHHASIRVRDVRAAREFYEGKLGFAPIERPEMGFPGVWYGLGEGQLHLIQSPDAGGERSRIDPTAPHFAVTVELEAMRERLEAAGLETLDFGGDQLWVLDPDGNTVELRRDPEV